MAVAQPKAESPMEPAVEKEVGEMEPTKGGKEGEVSPLENYLPMNGFDLNSAPSPDPLMRECARHVLQAIAPFGA